ncbi:hypothetical protein Tco_0487132, partial [Tanacetum coccineum]
AARSPGSNFDKDSFQYAESEVSEVSLPSELIVDHQTPVAITPQDGGLARKEDFLVITYHCHALNKSRNFDENSIANNSPNMRTLMTHHHALNKDEFPSDPNTPDMKSLPTRRHARIKLRKLGENRSDTNTRDTGSFKTTVVIANLITQGSEMTSCDVSASGTPALEEIKKILDEHYASH